MTFREKVALLLSGLEEGREVRAYLRRFSETERGCFAVIKVGGAILERELDTLAEALALLHALGLPPVVVYGSGPQLDARLAAAGFPEARLDGLRITPPGAVAPVVEAAGEAGLTLAAAIAARGGQAALGPPGTVRAAALDEARYGRVGEAAEVNAAALTAMLAAKTIPLIGCAHPDGDGRLLNVNADGIARAIIQALAPRKIVFVTGAGGLLDAHGRVINSVNLAEEGESLFASDWLDGGMAHKLKEIADLLSALPPASSVSITSAKGLIRELFTYSGEGTLVRLGEAIERFETADPARLAPLIEGAFGRPLRAGYWEALTPRYVLASAKGRGCAIVTRAGEIDCLDKFAIAKDARGEGLSDSLWRRLAAGSPRLIWRSRRDNPINPFYMRKADGLVRRDPWTVFWTGEGLEAAITPLADALAARPADFEAAP